MNRIIKKLPGGDFETSALSIHPIDVCVICKQPSPYTRDIPIEQREGYIVGSGQLCRKCDSELASWDNLF